jgi:hypothetical protein
MDQHTSSLLEKMLSLLRDFQQKQISLHYLVDGLEGTYNAIEQKLPKAFDLKWYEHWGALETILAVTVEGLSTEQQNESAIAVECHALELLIRAYLSAAPIDG